MTSGVLRRALVAVLAAALGVSVGCGPRDTGRVLEVELRSTSGHFSQLYWHQGSGFAEATSARADLVPGSADFQRVRFQLPEGALRGLRFDPIETSGDLQIRSVRVLSAAGDTLAVLRPGSLLSSNGIVSMTRSGEVLDVAMAAGAADPWLSLSADCINLATAPGSLMAVTPASLIIVSAAALALLLAAVGCIVRVALQQLKLPAHGLISARRATVAMTALFVAIVAAKLLLIANYPAPVPYLDQWNAEAQVVYIPYHDGCLSWREMASLHNEHRVFFTRLLALVTLVMNGQWDPRLQQVLNAMLHALTGVLAGTVLWCAGARRRPGLMFLVVGLVFGLPFGWENTLAGFQSAFYFLLLFSILAIWLVDSSSPGTLPWAVGWLCAGAALFTSAGGLITTLAIVLTVLLQWLNEPRRWRPLCANLGVAAVVLAVGAATASPPLEQHTTLKAASISDFAYALAANLAWPWIDKPAVAPFMWLPVIAWLLMSARSPRRTTSLDRLCLGLGAWAFLQAMAVAYARGVGGQPPASRYMDLSSVGFLINAVAAINLGSRVAGAAAARMTAAAAAGWLIIAFVGLDKVTEAQVRSGAEERRLWMAAYTTNVRRFVVTDDLAALSAHAFPREIPFPSPSTLANVWLRHEYIRRILPPSVREPLRLLPESPLGSSFGARGYYPTTPDPFRQTIGSYTELGNPAQGEVTLRSAGRCRDGARLEFEVAGYLGLPGLSLAVKDLSTSREYQIRSPKLAREAWLPVSVPCPEGRFAVTASDRNPEFWFAFDEPVEVSRGSMLAEYLISHAGSLLLLGLALIVFCLT